jgi:hypothetical protein
VQYQVPDSINLSCSAPTLCAKALLGLHRCNATMLRKMRVASSERPIRPRHRAHDPILQRIQCLPVLPLHMRSTCLCPLVLTRCRAPPLVASRFLRPWNLHKSLFHATTSLEHRFHRCHPQRREWVRGCSQSRKMIVAESSLSLGAS